MEGISWSSSVIKLFKVIVSFIIFACPAPIVIFLRPDPYIYKQLELLMKLTIELNTKI